MATPRLDIHDYQFKLFGVFFAAYALFWCSRTLLLFFNAGNELLIDGIGYITLIALTCGVLHLRDMIWKKEARGLQAWSLSLWIILGMALITVTVRWGVFLSTDALFFLMLTLFLADSYWNFKDIPSVHFVE